VNYHEQDKLLLSLLNVHQLLMRIVAFYFKLMETITTWEEGVFGKQNVREKRGKKEKRKVK